MIEAARAALEAGDDREAVARLLDAWAEHREPEIAQAIERIGDPDVEARLAATEKLGANAAATALGEIEDAVPHPIVARWVVTLLVRASHNPDRGAHLTSHVFWLAVASLLHKHAHVGLRDELDAVAGELTFTAMNKQPVRLALQRAINEVRAMSAPAPVDLADIVAILDARDGRRRASGKTGDELLAAIYAEPDEDGPRMVYADWLTERGDPRGELIVMQIERKHRGTPRASAEEKGLLARHGTAWLGALAPIVRKEGLRFERGFLTACEVFTSSEALADQLRDAREWATVEELALRNDLFETLGGDMRALRRLTGVYKTAPSVFAHPEQLRSLVHLGLRLAGLGPAIAACPGFERLRELDAEGSFAQGVDPSTYRWLWETPTGQRLERFSIGSGVQSLAGWLAEDAARRIPPTQLVLTSTRWSNTGPGWQLVMDRDGKGSLSRLVATRGAYRLYGPQPAPLDELCDALDRLAAGALSQIEIVATRSLAATIENRRRLEAAAGRLGAELRAP